MQRLLSVHHLHHYLLYLTLINKDAIGDAEVDGYTVRILILILILVQRNYLTTGMRHREYSIAPNPTFSLSSPPLFSSSALFPQSL